MLKLFVPIAALLLAVGVAVFSDKPQPPADFTFVNSGEVSTLDPQRMSWMQDLRVARIVFEGLTRNDIFSWGYDPIPAVAERWDVEDDRVYTFHLRSNAKWSNGEPVTAHDFVYTWRRGMLPDVASDYTKLFQLIKGADEFYAWRNTRLAAFKPGDDAHALWDETLAKFDELVALRAVDDHTLRVELKRRVPYFLSLTSFAVFYPVYPPLVRQYEHIDAQTGRLKLDPGWTKPPVLVTNGPFELVTWRFKRDMRFERNPHYWNPDAVAIDSINIPSIEDPNAQVLAFNSGSLDWVAGVTPPYRGDIYAHKLRFYREHWDEYQSLKAQGLDPVEIDRRLPPDPRKNVHAMPAFGTYFYNFNCRPTFNDGRPNPFHDPRVRRAFAMAIDKARLVDEVRRIGEPVATTLIPPDSIGGYTSPSGVPFNPAAARQLLAEAGFPDGRGFPTVELLFNRDAGHDVIAQAIAKDWERYLNVPVMLAQKELKVYRNDLKNHNFMTTRAGWFGDYGDPTTFLEINRTGDGNNDRDYSSPRFDALLDAADAETDPQKRLDLLSQAEAILVNEDLPLVPLFHYSQLYLFDPHKISGISAHPRQEQTPTWIDVLGDGKGPDVPKALPSRPSHTGNRAPVPAPTPGTGGPQ